MMGRKRKLDAGPEFNCLRPEHREGYALYLRGRPLDEVREFLARVFGEPDRRIHFLHPPEGCGETKAWDYLNGHELSEVVAAAEPGDPHFEMETDTEDVPF